MKPRKRFGQHFLTDKQSLHNIRMAIAPHSNDHLVEIGPGQGALTDYLVGTAKQIDLIEIDRDLTPLLKNKYEDRVTIHETDALTFDFHQLKQDQKLRVVGNLPYNISTPLLFHLFDQIDIIKDMHFLLQKEVVDRMSAKLGSHNYGRLSIMTSYYCQVIPLLTLSPEAFNPPPKVTSTFVRLIPREKRLAVNSLRQLQTVVGEAFNYRRKTLSNSLKRLITEKQLQTLGIDPKKRPQELSVEDYVRITNLIEVD